MPAQAPEKPWMCENCTKRIAERRGFETVIKCRHCGHENVA